ncbi:MAG: membrane protein insertion efficiency factor YidD [Candidatus Dependentiae bacterium]
MYYCLRPLLGPAQCRFKLSCGPYAVKQLEEKPLFHALYTICKRVWSCSPWGSFPSHD